MEYIALINNFDLFSLKLLSWFFFLKLKLQSKLSNRILKTYQLQSIY